MLYVRPRYNLIASILLGATLVAGCLPAGDKDKDATPSPTPPKITEVTCGDGRPYDVILQARNQFTWPFFTECRPSEFWDWHDQHHSSRWLGRAFFFDDLDSVALSQVHLQKETLIVDAVIFDTDHIDFNRLNISMNGLKGISINKDAVTTRILDTHDFDHWRIFHGRLDESKDDDTNISGNHHKGRGHDENDGEHHDGSDGEHDSESQDGPPDVEINQVTVVEISFHLEDFIFGINQSAADLLRSSAVADAPVSFKVSHIKGFLRILNGLLHLQGAIPGKCSTPTPAPTPSPSPTATPIPTPTPTPQPPPAASITQTSAGTLSNSNSIQVSFVADQVAQFNCSLDASPFSSCTSPFSQGSLTDGLHHFSVEAFNGNGMGAPAHFDWTIDTTPPVVSFGSISPPNALTDLTQITLNFSANESSTFECQLDGGLWTPCSSPITKSNMLDGQHFFAVRATDLAGNLGQPANYSWTVKTTPPVVTITGTVPPNNPSNSASRTFSFTGTADTSSFTCGLDAQTRVVCTSPYQVTGLTDGSHQFFVWALDGAGNTSAPAVNSFTIDTVAPNVMITSTIPSQSPTNSSSMQIAFSANESASFSCILDGVPATPCISPISYSALSSGSHDFQVSATDTAGNLSVTPAQYKWVVDTTLPVVTLVSANPSGSVFNQHQIALNFSVSKPSTVACTLDNGVPADCSSGTVAYLGLADGSHSVAISATDAAGNVSATLVYNFTVDNTLPVVNIISVAPSANPSNQSTISFTFGASEAVTFQCALDAGTFANCTSPQSYSALADGSHTFRVQGLDLAGNMSASPAVYSWAIDTVAPATQITAINPTGSTTSSTTISFNFSSNEPATFQCQLDGSGFSACVSPVTYNGLADGSHRFDVFATDLAGNRDPAGASYTWTVNTQPALIISNFAIANVSQTTATFTWTTNLASNSTVSYVPGSQTTYTAVTDATLVTSHSVTLTGLTQNTLYNVFVTSTTVSGNSASNSPSPFRTAR